MPIYSTLSPLYVILRKDPNPLGYFIINGDDIDEVQIFASFLASFVNLGQ